MLRATSPGVVPGLHLGRLPKRAAHEEVAIGNRRAHPTPTEAGVNLATY